ncbi:MAG TPA: hypothetical protein VFO21_16805 [Vicinamibacterales bacterium]|nr:hypothetical protein [Vicinamibacterales bacterium]
MRSWFPRLVLALGLALVCAALMVNQSWLDRHFLPSFFVPRRWYVWIESAVRIGIAAIGLLLVLARGRVTRVLTHSPGLTVQVLAAALLAVVAAEFAVRRIHQQPAEWQLRDEEPRRQEDAQLGWVLVPGRVGHVSIGGRSIEYAVDSNGYRVRRAGESVDAARPAIVFGGESVMFGEGLTWEESIPAQVESLTGIQSANLAVHGYSTDQIYLRLTRELPRFRRPAAVVTIFMTELFGRNLDADRPHLAPGLVWRPAVRKARLAAMAGWLVPFRRETTVERGIGVTREALHAIVRLARDRGATPLVVVPQFGPEDDALRALRERIVTADLPSLVVPLDPDWRLPWDRHPNARAAGAVAAAVARTLRVREASRKGSPHENTK